MLCERCGINSAEVFLVKIMEGERHVEHLCRKCAKELLPFEDAAKMMKMTFSLEGVMDMQDALKDLLFPVLPELYGENAETFRCPHCGGTLPKSMFEKAEKTVSEEHQGESSVNSSADEMTTLKCEMDIAVRDENYERAAEIRDKIKALENREGKKEA
jgi:protein arginine kinase activator